MTYPPQFFPSYWSDDNEVFGIQFTDEISIGFVIREDGGYSYLLKDDFKNLNIKANSLLYFSVKLTPFIRCKLTPCFDVG